jgi:beta-ureidopropionase / N-carbamoyl-L-amino-acid hydrolase
MSAQHSGTDLRQAMGIDIGRLRADVEQLARFGASEEGGVTRRAFSPVELEARAWLRRRAEEAGLATREDAIGNVFVRLDGPEGPPVWTGSHIDTVPNGGRLDGALGVVAALECLRCLREANVELARPIEAVAFADEEGTFYGHLGSKSLAHDLDLAQLSAIVGPGEVRLGDVLDLGANGALPARTALRPGAVHAFVELHIEQGPTLEAERTSIGVVTQFVGVGRGHIRFVGRSDHAGTTPMGLRRDALRGASDFVLEAPKLPHAIGQPSAVVTVGRIEIASGAQNVVPGDVTIYLDFRTQSRHTLELLEQALIALGRECGGRHDLDAEYVAETLTDPVPLTPRIPNLVEAVACDLGISSMRMSSGASHDAQVIAGIAPAGMIFVPSRDGRSHSPLEDTAWEDIENGANVLLEVVRRLACEPSIQPANGVLEIEGTRAEQGSV